MKTFHVEIVTPTDVKFEGELRQLVVMGVMGQMGILAHHAPLLAMLQPGMLSYTDATGKVVRMAAGAGFVQVAENKAVCLVDFAEAASEVDVAAARASAEEVGRKLQASAATPAEREVLREELKMAQARLEVAGQKV